MKIHKKDVVDGLCICPGIQSVIGLGQILGNFALLIRDTARLILNEVKYNDKDIKSYRKEVKEYRIHSHKQWLDIENDKSLTPEQREQAFQNLHKKPDQETQFPSYDKYRKNRDIMHEISDQVAKEAEGMQEGLFRFLPIVGTVYSIHSIYLRHSR